MTFFLLFPFFFPLPFLYIAIHRQKNTARVGPRLSPPNGTKRRGPGEHQAVPHQLKDLVQGHTDLKGCIYTCTN